MASAAASYIRRWTRALTEDVGERDAQEMADSSREEGATHACDCQRGDEVTLIGRLRSVEARSASGRADVVAGFFDGTDEITLVWIGRRRIHGIEAGTRLLVRGRVGERDGNKVIFNPYYELRADAT
ncbi:MAG: OB-fold nucleic acid binding domain-containing protein [Rhodococcus sp.]|nr:OB-fold nucleic acid binding domain-containing protein [Rhodococcus sp. (in: high G+C Gram-positive bacteria)]